MSFLESAASQLQIGDRDIQLLRGFFESRVMSLEHVASLYFDGKAEYAKKRIQQLKAAGLIAERPRKPFEASILYLTGDGLRPLKERGVLSEYPEFDLPVLERRARVSAMTLAHELEVVDVKAAFHSALRNRSNFSIAEFTTWPQLNEFTTFKASGSEFRVKPDGFIRIHGRESDGISEHCFFLEVDRSTETQDLLAARAAAYLAYYSSGGFADRNGASRAAFEQYPFRVLMVFKTPERRNNTAERLLSGNPPILRHTWLSTIHEVRSDPFGSIWIQPVDYRDVISGLERAESSSRRGYQRQTARDLRVDERVKRSRLLD